MPAKLDIDGTPEQSPRKRGRPPRVSVDIPEHDSAESDPSQASGTEARLRAMADGLEELRISMNQLGEDIFQRLDDNTRAASLVREGGSEKLTSTITRLDATNAELHDAITVMIQRYDASAAMLAACDRISRQRYERMTREVNTVIARHLKEDSAKPVPKPMPIWLLSALWLGAPIVGFLALFGLYSFFR